MYEMYYQTQSQLEDHIQSTNLMPPVVLGFFVWVIPYTLTILQNPTSPWVRRAAIAVPFFLVCPLVTHDSVCVWWEGLVHQHSWHEGSWSRWSALSCLRELNVGWKRRSRCRLWCCFSSGGCVHTQLSADSFICAQLRCHLSFCVWTVCCWSLLGRKNAFFKESLQKSQQRYCRFHPSRSYFSWYCILINVLWLHLAWFFSLRLCFHCCLDLILPLGINKVHFILPVWVVLITECCL